jgi:hypothetical protein
MMHTWPSSAELGLVSSVAELGVMSHEANSSPKGYATVAKDGLGPM